MLLHQPRKSTRFPQVLKIRLFGYMQRTRVPLCPTHNHLKIFDHRSSKIISSEMAAVGTSFNHVARETLDVDRLANFYQEIFGFERIENPKFDCKVIWLKQSPSFCLHLIERDSNTKLPEGPWSANSAVADPKNLPRGHHLCFSVSNFDLFVKILKEKGIETYEKAQPDGKTKQVFFFDPDGEFLT